MIICFEINLLAFWSCCCYTLVIMNPEHVSILDTIIKAIVAYFAIEAIFGIIVIGLFVLLAKYLMDR